MDMAMDTERMNEMQRSEKESTTVREQRREQNYDLNAEGIDLISMLDDALRCFKYYWFQFLLLIVIVTAGFIATWNRTYQPKFQAKVTYAVSKTGISDIDVTIAQRLSNAIPVLAKNQEFQADLLKNADERSINRNYSISSSYTEGSNLFAVMVSANNYENANMLLEMFEKIYPDWASASNGSVSLQVVDRSLAGATPVNAYSAVRQLIEGILAGIVLCLGIALLYTQTIKTVRKESDMKKITSKGCVSQIPEIQVKKREKSKKQQLVLTNKRVDWGFKQSLQAAQLRIEKLMEQKNQKVLLISSTIPQEGKSMTAANLALAFAQHGKKTVLIDGDLRKPSVNGMLGLEEKIGLAEYLKGKAELDKIFDKKGELTVIQAGKKHGNVSAIMDEDRMEALMQKLRDTFEYIIIDTPPAFLFSDASILSGYADSVLYVVRYDMAEAPQISKGMEPFILENKLMGYVINRTQSGFSYYGKYGYGKYGYGKYGKYKRYVKEEEAMNTEDTL